MSFFLLGLFLLLCVCILIIYNGIQQVSVQPRNMNLGNP
jgi:hypothetical protein